MGAIHVGIGEVGVSGSRDDVLKTFALGSCVAVIVYDKVNKVAGLMHVALPESSVNGQKAKEMPGYFADTGLPILMEEMNRSRAQRSFMTIKLVGGSNIMDDGGRFDIGKRNVLAIKKLLWKCQLGIISEDTGGSISRTVSVSVDTGEVIVSSAGKQWSL